jgi:purine-nucleoside phosphorylase
MILMEYDDEIISTFNPEELETKIDNFPKIGVTCFSNKIIDRYIELHNPEIIGQISSANGKIPIYKIIYKGVPIALFMSRVGAPACTIGYEEVLAMGLEKLIMFGTCGVLDKRIEDCSIIIPNSAVRDEGTSYHYLKGADEVLVNDKYQQEFIEILEEHNYNYTIGKTWTIDAPYRETRGKVLKRKEQGCICVEMECASMVAVAKFRNKDFFNFFYAADNLDNIKWDKRSLGCDDRLSAKERILLLAFELAIRIG